MEYNIFIFNGNKDSHFIKTARTEKAHSNIIKLVGYKYQCVDYIKN